MGVKKTIEFEEVKRGSKPPSTWTWRPRGTDGVFNQAIKIRDFENVSDVKLHKQLKKNLLTKAGLGLPQL
jgi:hypothetical protein